MKANITTTLITYWKDIFHFIWPIFLIYFRPQVDLMIKINQELLDRDTELLVAYIFTKQNLLIANNNFVADKWNIFNSPFNKFKIWNKFLKKQTEYQFYKEHNTFIIVRHSFLSGKISILFRS